MELFELMTETDIVHVPYRATTAAIADVIGGRIELVLIGLSSAKPQIDGGRLRAFGIASPQRSSLLPDVPTMDEAGLPNYYVYSWFGIFAPAKTPQHIVERLAARSRRQPRIRGLLRRWCRRACRSSHLLRRTPSLQCGTIEREMEQRVATTGVTIDQ